MDELDWPLWVSALATGVVFGYVIQRGGFCLTRAFSNLVLMGDATILRAYVLALVVAMVGVHGLLAAELVEIPIRPLHPLSNVVGGVLFGFGMILAGGCSGSTWYRVGEGAIGAWVVLLGFAIGATTVGVGILAPVRTALQRVTLPWGGPTPTLASVTGLPPWLVIAVLAAGAGWWLARGRGEPEHGKWRWPLTGGAVGALIAAGWWTSSFGDRSIGITFAANTGHLLTYPLVGFPTRVTWSMVMALGVPVGAFIGAWLSGEFRWKLPAGWSLLKIFAGGLLMGSAALVAEGCNINQGLTNSATLALGSLLTFASMGAGAWLAVRLLYLRSE
ncbi:MAG TPA: YeeE/YedE family protein [Methylomirabilota bacterium]|nr:YeeE/YedE family protein [Methylomirabilota bacterium]